MLLSSENFFLAGKNMNITLTGNTLVFFKSEKCQGCRLFTPIFAQISQQDKRVNYATIDVSHYPTIVQMSKNSTTVITRVPHIIMYVQGKPYARFTGERTASGLKEFLDNVLSTIVTQSPPTPVSFVQPQQNHNAYGYQQPQQRPPTMQPYQQSPHQSMQNQCDPDDEECLKMPSHIVPYNTPWETEFKKMAGEL